VAGPGHKRRLAATHTCPPLVSGEQRKLSAWLRVGKPGTKRENFSGTASAPVRGGAWVPSLNARHPTNRHVAALPRTTTPVPVVCVHQPSFCGYTLCSTRLRAKPPAPPWGPQVSLQPVSRSHAEGGKLQDYKYKTAIPFLRRFLGNAQGPAETRSKFSTPTAFPQSRSSQLTRHRRPAPGSRKSSSATRPPPPRTASKRLEEPRLRQEKIKPPCESSNAEIPSSGIP